MLNTDSPIPLYHQLADILLGKIRNGMYSPGTRIPSEHNLARDYGIGRPTARQATDLLVRKGLLIRKRGSGTFVQTRKQEVDLFTLAGTMASFENEGISVRTRSVCSTRLINVKHDMENPFYNKEAYFLSRLSHVEKTPVLLEDIFLDPVFFKDIDRIDMEMRSLSQIVREQYYMRPMGGKQNFKIGYPNEKRAGLLGVSRTTPILTVNRFIHFSNVNTAIYSDLFCRTDRFIFSQTLGGIQTILCPRQIGQSLLVLRRQPRQLLLASREAILQQQQ
jgi:GntR family transcriptional regulator